MGRSGLMLKDAEDDGKWYPVIREPNGSVPVTLQDQTTRIIFLKAIIEEGTFNIKTDMSPQDQSFEALNTHGITVGDIVEFHEPSQFFMQSKVLSISVDDPIAGTDTITIDTPVDYPYSAASCVCYRGIDNLNVLGTAGAPIIARIKNTDLTVDWDITEVDIIIQDDAAMDTSIFGGLASALTNGVVWRAKVNGFYGNGFNAKTNGDLIMNADKHDFTDKAPTNKHALLIKKYIGGQQHLGVVVRLGAGGSTELEFLIRDDLRGLEIFNLRYQGSQVQA